MMKKGLLLLLCLLLTLSAACAHSGEAADAPDIVSCRLSDAGLEPGSSAGQLIIAYCQQESIAYTVNDGMYDNFYGRASTDKEGWLLYIDSVIAELGADSISVESADTLVEFRYISYAEAFPEFYQED